MSKATDLLDRHKSLRKRHDPWNSLWQELSEVMLPNQATFTRSINPGEQRGGSIYDGTPRLALRDLATTLDGLIKPKSSSWFDTEVDNEDLMEYDEVKLWLEQVKERMWNAIYRKDARFIQRSGEVDLSLACFGWGVLWIQENRARNGLLFRSFHNSQVAIDENAEGIIDTISIEEKLSARQAYSIYQRSGKSPSTKIMEALKDPRNTSEKNFTFVQLVMPREDFNSQGIGNDKMPFASVLLDVSDESIIDESGFMEFPAAVPRWETSPGEIYARSPGMMALPDSQTLQAMGKTLLVGGQRAVDPPIWVMNDSVMSPLRTFPGGISVLDSSDGGTPIGTFPASTNIPIGREMQNDYRRQVEAAFFKNVFNLPIESRQMTATEIVARKEEFIRVIGPVFGRLESDYIGHIAERVFGIMERAGALPPRPDYLQGVEVTFRFKSPIQQARKQMEIAGLSQSLQFLAPLAEVQQDILDNFDGDAITRDAPEWGGMPNKWMRSIKDVEARRQARTQDATMQQQLAAAGPVSQAIRNVSGAEQQLASANAMNPIPGQDIGQ
jgi:hypothetical protein